MSLPLDGFAKTGTLLVHSPFLILDQIPLRLSVMALARRDAVRSKPPQDVCVRPYSLCGKLDCRFTFDWLTNYPYYKTCLGFCWFTHTLLKPGFARQKVSLPPGMARDLNYIILSERMAYYPGYATGKDGIAIGSHWYN
jgi:hypothetical protein